jgi:hypothetical protein
MKAHSYNKELKYATAQFIDALCNDIIVHRTKGGASRNIKVKSVYGDRSRIFKSLANPGKTQVLPIIVASIDGIARDTSRVAGMNDFLTEIPDVTLLDENDYQKYYNQFYPNPVDITFTVDFLTKYHDDFDQIICNFIAFCNPSFYVTTKHPKIEGAKLQHQIVWDGTISTDFPRELAPTVAERYAGTTTFTFKTWIFPGDDFISDADYGVIHKINFYPELSDEPSLSGVWSLSNWYAVDLTDTFDRYQNAILEGKIKLPYYDFLPISGNSFLSGSPSGYWHSVSAAVSGIDLGSGVSILTGDPVFLVDANGDLLIFSEANVASPAVTSGDVSGFIRYIEERQ